MSHRSERYARDEVYQRVTRGELKPEEAEKLAQAKGWQPFEWAPDWPEFDPTVSASAITWTTTMVVVWISTRDPKQVRESWNEYRQHCTCWHPFDDGTFFLQTVHPMSLSLCIISSPHLKKSLEDLFVKLRHGELKASGINSNGEAIEIPSVEWRYLDFFQDNAHEDVVRKKPMGSVEYRDIRFLREDVLRTWAAVDGLYKSGGPGQPNARHFYMEEFDRRVAEGTICPILKDEAKYLLELTKKNHPDYAPGNVRSIENAIRARYNAARKAKA